MAIHYLLSKKVRDMSLLDLAELSEIEARNLFAEMRWGSSNTQVCPDCGSVNNHYEIKGRNQWRCKDCTFTFSVTSDTIFADRKMSYKKMLFGVFLFMTASNGLSASELSRMIGVTHKVAWLFLNKLREALIHNRNLTQLEGTIQIDGTYVGGKPRKGRLRKRRDDGAIKNKIESNGKLKRKMTKNDHRNWIRKKENRRLVLVIRELHKKPKLGAKRTIVTLIKDEKEEYVKPLATRYIKPGSYIMTDENGAYNFLSANYEHDTVEHSKEYATVDGINNNQAESYNSRLKRSLNGVLHRAMPQYIFDYSVEMAWREDMRRSSQKERFENLWEKVFSTTESKWWRRYDQGFRRNDELLMF